MQDHALPLGRDEKANRLDVGQRDFIKIQDRWNTTRGNFRAHMSDVFRLHVTDQTNRGPVFIDIRDDPQSHECGRANARRWCNRQTCGDRNAANDLQERDVLMFQNLPICRHRCGGFSKVEGHCAVGAGEDQRLLYRCLSMPSDMIFESSV